MCLCVGHYVCSSFWWTGTAEPLVQIFLNPFVRRKLFTAPYSVLTCGGLDLSYVAFWGEGKENAMKISKRLGFLTRCSCRYFRISSMWWRKLDLEQSQPPLLWILGHAAQSPFLGGLAAWPRGRSGQSASSIQPLGRSASHPGWPPSLGRPTSCGRSRSYHFNPGRTTLTIITPEPLGPAKSAVLLLI